MISLELNIAKPIILEIKVDNGYTIIPDQVPASEPLFTGSEAFKLKQGDKARLDKAVTWGENERYSAIHAGFLGEMSITDDYLFVCVKSGTAGNAIWKKTILFNS